MMGRDPKNIRVCVRRSESIGNPDEVIEKNGERGGNRTYNLVIKSHLLCQLSYAPAVASD